MSNYYVVGTDEKLDDLKKLNGKFELIEKNNLVNLTGNNCFNKKYYYASNYYVSPLKILGDNAEKTVINFDDSQTDFAIFAEFLQHHNFYYETIEFYKFWSLFDEPNNKKENVIDKEKEINILKDFDPNQEFDYNTKYIFKQEF